MFIDRFPAIECVQAQSLQFRPIVMIMTSGRPGEGSALTEEIPLVSVLTPALNPGREVVVAAQSIAAQTLLAGGDHHLVEWIIVDDGSTWEQQDHFRAASYIAAVRTTVVRRERPGGQGAARNLALSHAKGRYVKFCDADDALSEAHLERLIDVAETWAAERVLPFAPTRHIFTKSGRTVVNRSYLTAGETAQEQLSHFLVSPFLHHCGVLFPRELAAALGPYDPTLRTDEDGDLLIRILLAGYRFRAVEGTFYDYRHHRVSGRVSHDDDLEKLAARRTVSRRVVEHYRASGTAMPLQVRAAVATRLDLLAARSERAHPEFARELLDEARRLAPGYRLSGSRTERLLRTLVGLSASQRVLMLARRIRGKQIP